MLLVGSGCLGLVGLGLLLPALFLALFSVASGAGEETRSTTATVVDISPGEDVDGVAAFLALRQAVRWARRS